MRPGRAQGVAGFAGSGQKGLSTCVYQEVRFRKNPRHVLPGERSRLGTELLNQPVKQDLLVRVGNHRALDHAA